MAYSTEEVGRSWWDAYNAMSALGPNPESTQIAGDFYQSYLGPLLESGQMDYWGGGDVTSESIYGGIMSEYGNLFGNLSIDPTDMYRIEATSELKENLLLNKFKDEDVKSYMHNVGSSGFATSRNDMSRQLQAYQRSLAQNEDLVESSYSDVFSQFGEDFIGQFEMLTSAGAWDPWLDTDEEDTGWYGAYSEIEGADWEDDYNTAFDTCVQGSMSGAYQTGNFDPSAYAGIQSYCHDTAYMASYPVEYEEGETPDDDGGDTELPDDFSIGVCTPCPDTLCPDGSCMVFIEGVGCQCM